MSNQRKPTQPLAKLTRPRLYASVPRERLSGRLDTRQAAPVVWVTGPAGSGKSTLVSAFLARRRRKTYWYNVDEDDLDVASLFYYLAELAGYAGKHTIQPLPYLTPEYLSNVPGFARRFFREFYRRLPEGCALVFDNCHHAESTLFHEILREAVIELPAGRGLYLTSRLQLPVELASMHHRGDIGVLGAEDLKLTEAEAQAIARARRHLSPEKVEALRVSVDGWVTGLILLLANQQDLLASQVPSEVLHEEVFRYFAGEIFNRSASDVRHVLVSTCLLSDLHVNAAIALSGDPNAARVLDRLYRNHYFINRGVDGELRYRFHDLFRRFLLQQFEEQYTPKARVEKRTLAAGLLEADGRPTEALDLYAQAQAWDEGGRLILTHAPALINGGRWQTLRGWIDKLPKSRLSTSSWHCYWRAVSASPLDPDDALTWFWKAQGRFHDEGNALGEFLCAAGALMTIYVSGRSQARVDGWIPIVRNTLHAADRIEDDELHTQSLAMAIFVVNFRLHGDPFLDELKQRLEPLLTKETLSASSHAWVVAVLSQFAWAECDYSLMQRIETNARALVHEDQTNATATLLSLGWYGTMLIPFNRIAQASAAFERGMSLAHAQGLDGAFGYNASMRAVTLAVLEEFELAAKCAQSGRQYLRDNDGAAMTQILHGEYLIAARTKQVQRAIELHDAVEETARRSDASHMVGIQRLHHCDLLVEIGRLEEARELLEFIDEWLRAWRFSCFDTEMAAIRAALTLQQSGWAAAQPLLDEVLDGAQLPGQCGHLRFAIHSTRALFNAAFEQRHAVERVAELIRTIDLAPGSEASADWPCAIRLFTLGRFEIEVNGAPVRFSGKLPKKPLTLLKSLAAAGGASVRKSALVDQLWPDLDGDAADKAFRMALMRLRELLGHADAIIHAPDLLSLNTRRVWVDAAAFDRLVARYLAQQSSVDFQRACDYYQGVFLPGDQELISTVSLRERLREQFLRLIDSHARRSEDQLQWVEALGVYERGIGIDDLVESFHQGKIRCLQGAGRAGDVAPALQQLRQTLARKLGIGPSSATLALVAQGRSAA